MPGFGIDYNKTAAVNIAEQKNINKGSYKIPVRYYPGIFINVPLPRAPLQPTLNYFMPALFVSCFILAANNIAADGRDGVMEVVGIAMLTYVQLYQQVRENIPNTKEITTMEAVMIIYMAYCIIPLADIMF